MAATIRKTIKITSRALLESITSSMRGAEDEATKNITPLEVGKAIFTLNQQAVYITISDEPPGPDIPASIVSSRSPNPNSINFSETTKTDIDQTAGTRRQIIREDAPK